MERRGAAVVFLRSGCGGCANRQREPYGLFEELIFTMLGERVTTEISQKEKPDTFTKSKQVAQRGGSVAGVAREQASKQAEKGLGRSIIPPDYFPLDSDRQDNAPQLPFEQSDEQMKDAAISGRGHLQASSIFCISSGEGRPSRRLASRKLKLSASTSSGSMI